MNRVAWLWRKLRGNKVNIVAGVLTGGEALVSAGVPLPFAESIPTPARAVLIAGLFALGWYYRQRAQKEALRG